MSRLDLNLSGRCASRNSNLTPSFSSSPALSKAKAEALRIQCVNNQRQLMLTWAMYFNNNREMLALNGGDQAVVSS